MGKNTVPLQKMTSKLDREQERQAEHLSQVQEEFLNIVACFIRDTAYVCPEEMFEKHASENPASGKPAIEKPVPVPASEKHASGNPASGEDGGLGFMEKLLELSVRHKLSPAVFEVLRTSLREEQLQQIPFWKSWKSTIIRESVFQTQRTAAFLAVYKELLEAGICPLVVKGIVCRSLYSKPDYRASSDEDLLVRAEDAAICDSVLLSRGFRRAELDLANLPHEISYSNPMNGVYLEVHFTLFDEVSGVFGHLNQVFEDVFEKAVCLKIQSMDVWTLEPTKHFLYLVCHCYKHFLHSGFGIRQVCDIVLMAEKWRSDIDWQYLNEQLERLHMSRFLRGLLDIGCGWLGMEEETYEYITGGGVSDTQVRKDSEMKNQNPAICRSEVEDLLVDILVGGIYGNSSSERKHSANMTLAAAEKKSGILRSLFPGKRYMEQRYPFVKKLLILLPVAWFMRLYEYLSKKDSRESGMEIGRQRVELLKKYDVIR